jgi:nucleoside phosphorylase
VILAATGLRREARILTRPGVVVVAGGGDAVRLERELEARVGQARAVLSIGLGGALAEGLRAGDWVIGDSLAPPSSSRRKPGSMDTGAGGCEVAFGLDPQGAVTMDPDFHRDDEKGRDDEGGVNARWLANLQILIPNARTGPIHADGTMIATAADKRALHAVTGAIAADMESHIAARVAARHKLPFVIIRVISDAADRDLPRAVRLGMKPDGGMAPGAVILDLLRDPRQLPALIRIAIDAERAFRSLLSGYDALAGLGIGLTDLGDLPLDLD